MKQSLPVTVYVYAYFSQYGSPGDAPTFSSSLYENAGSNYVLVATFPRELEFDVPDSVADYTPARLAALAAKIKSIQLSAAQDTKEITDQMDKLLCIENSAA